jgi:plasmid stabilization system protein ParE
VTAPRFSFRRAASADLAEAYWRHEREAAGLGEELLAAVRDAVAGAAEEPERYPVVRADVRRVLVRRFPYAVFYRVRRGRVVVIAVVHHRRDPRVWHRRG